MSYRAGFIGLIGQPNAGKSSLMNFFVKEKVSIVTNKPQTTRRRIIGVRSTDAGQIVFVDAPGFIQAEKGLNGFLAKEAHDVIEQSDALIAVISVDEKAAEDAKKVIELASQSRKPWVGVINKTDLLEFQHRVMILKDLIEKSGGKAYTMSTLKATKEERETMMTDLLELLPESPAPLYDIDLFTTENTRDMVAEIVREKCFEFLFNEIPYNLAVKVLKYDEAHEPCVKIAMEIMVAKDNHKAIVIGKGGESIKKIGSAARQDIEKLLGEKIFLDISVSCREEWYKNTNMMKELGYHHDNKN